MVKKPKTKKLHLGCGKVAPADWINIDSSWNAWLTKHPLLKLLITKTNLIKKDYLEIAWPKNILHHDLTKKLPFDDNSIDCIYSSHTLEHLYLDQAKNLLKECFRVLKPKGVIRIVLPDLKTLIIQYLSPTKKHIGGWETNADSFIDQLQLRSSSSNNGNFIFRFYNKVNDTASHKWMYDNESLKYILKLAGFKDIKKRKVYQSKIRGIKNIEQSNRLENAICLEGEKI